MVIFFYLSSFEKIAQLENMALKEIILTMKIKYEKSLAQNQEKVKLTWQYLVFLKGLVFLVYYCTYYCRVVVMNSSHETH